MYVSSKSFRDLILQVRSCSEETVVAPVVTQCLQAAIAGTAALLTAVGTIRIWSLVVTALAMGMVFAVDAPARQVYVMELAGGDRVAGAISGAGRDRRLACAASASRPPAEDFAPVSVHRNEGRPHPAVWRHVTRRPKSRL